MRPSLIPLLCALAPPPAAPTAAAPRPEDVASIDGIIKAFYEVVCVAPGQTPDWARDRTLYIPGVRFVSMSVSKEGKPEAHVLSHPEFIEFSAPLARDGFWEREIHRSTFRFGNIAHVLSTYESRRSEKGRMLGRGVNSIELYWDGKRWWIASAIWDTERPGNPLPKDLLP
ncbi:MAG TPA: nuclear transport factor 2 family protein [Polyangia bacterium]|nr:nuclear transport factor 2 family protein [Polyangia bacterium]